MSVTPESGSTQTSDVLFYYKESISHTVTDLAFRKGGFNQEDEQLQANIMIAQKLIKLALRVEALRSSGDGSAIDKLFADKEISVDEIEQRVNELEGKP